MNWAFWESMIIVWIVVEAIALLWATVQSIACRALGAIPFEISVGIGPAIGRRKWRSYMLVHRLVPLGVTVRIRSRTDPETIEELHVAPDSSSTAYAEDLSTFKRIALLLLGPFTTLAIGVMLLALPVLMQSRQLYRDPGALSDFRWSAVPGLRESDRRATASGQVTLIRQTAVEFIGTAVRLRLDDLKGWGAMVGAVVTTASAAVVNFGHMLSCLGVLYCVGAFMNILPVPTMSGGQILILCYEKARNRSLSDRAYDALGAFTIVFYLIVLSFVFTQDSLWFRGLP